MKKKILIIGSAGYVGSSLLEVINTKYNNVYTSFGLDTLWFQDMINNKSIHRTLPDFFLKRDIRNFKLSEISEKFDIIVYLAAISNDPMGKAFTKVTSEINYSHCIKLATDAKIRGVKRFIFASSCSIYGASGNDFKKESDPINPLTDYAISKVKSEEALEKLSTKNFKVICLRFATAAGFSNKLRLDLVFNDFVAKATYSKKIELLSSGDSFRPIIHVRDMAESILWASKFNMKNKSFLALNTGFNDWNYKVINLAKKISRILKVSDVVIKNKNNIDHRSYRVNFDLYNKLSGIKNSEISLVKAVRELNSKLIKYKINLINYRESNQWIRLNNLKYLRKNNFVNEKLFWKK